MKDRIAELMKDVQIPAFYRVEYDVCAEEITDIKAAVKKALERKGTLERIEEGSSVAITAGSREINHIDVILKTLIDLLASKGAHPFIVPAMGSHGGATAQGQKDMIAQFGITEAAMGVPIRSSMQTQMVGMVDGIEAHVDSEALRADYIIPVGRIKPHTDFKGSFESGLMKMIAIGLGKQQGASICHKLGMKNMSKNVFGIGKKILETCSIPFGMGIIENAFHGTWKIEAVPAERLEQEEPVLLLEAKKLVPVIPFEKVDVIVCEEMGKDISGTGMDSNVIGRSASLGITKPDAERIGVFRLTEKSHGNANGVGLADSITKKFYESLKKDQTYPNAITSAETTAVKIPAVMDTDELCVRFLIKTCTGSGLSGLRVVWIKNTLCLNDFYVSRALREEAAGIAGMRILDELYDPVFDLSGEYLRFEQQENRKGDIK